VKPRVRARRGQATDPHSIAERVSFSLCDQSTSVQTEELHNIFELFVWLALCIISLTTISYMLQLRREKISDRMKNLQDLVPNSNKVHFFGGLTCLVHFHIATGAATAVIKTDHRANYQNFATYICNGNMYFLVVA
jgi:hypothetical protein